MKKKYSRLWMFVCSCLKREWKCLFFLSCPSLSIVSLFISAPTAWRVTLPSGQTLDEMLWSLWPKGSAPASCCNCQESVWIVLSNVIMFIMHTDTCPWGAWLKRNTHLRCFLNLPRWQQSRSYHWCQQWKKVALFSFRISLPIIS